MTASTVEYHKVKRRRIDIGKAISNE
jgi:hypothetical protein